MHLIKVDRVSTPRGRRTREEKEKAERATENDRAPLRRRKLRLGVKYRYEDLLVLHVRAIYGGRAGEEAAAHSTIPLPEGLQKKRRRRGPRTAGRTRLGRLERGTRGDTHTEREREGEFFTVR